MQSSRPHERALRQSDEPFAHRPIQHMVQRAREPVEQRIDLGVCYDQRRANRDGVADDRAHDQSFCFRQAHGLRANTLRRLECPLRDLIGDQLDPGNQT